MGLILGCLKVMVFSLVCLEVMELILGGFGRCMVYEASSGYGAHPGMFWGIIGFILVYLQGMRLIWGCFWWYRTDLEML